MKSDFHLAVVSKAQAGLVLGRYHYLKDESAGFKSGFNYGLFRGLDLIGVVVFTGFPVPELAVGCFGLGREDQDGLFELSRLCLDPEVQGTEHNLASWFLSRSIKMLRKVTLVRAVLSYADDNHHRGTVYRASNFTYYGLSAEKKDFWYLAEDGSARKLARGSNKNLVGMWLPRSRKHRFLMIFDKSLKCKWEVRT